MRASSTACITLWRSAYPGTWIETSFGPCSTRIAGLAEVAITESNGPICVWLYALISTNPALPWLAPAFASASVSSSTGTFGLTTATTTTALWARASCTDHGSPLGATEVRCTGRAWARRAPGCLVAVVLVVGVCATGLCRGGRGGAWGSSGGSEVEPDEPPRVDVRMK